MSIQRGEKMIWMSGFKSVWIFASEEKKPCIFLVYLQTVKNMPVINLKSKLIKSNSPVSCKMYHLPRAKKIMSVNNSWRFNKSCLVTLLFWFFLQICSETNSDCCKDRNTICASKWIDGFTALIHTIQLHMFTSHQTRNLIENKTKRWKKRCRDHRNLDFS